MPTSDSLSSASKPASPPATADCRGPSKRRKIGVQLVIACCVLLTLVSVAANVLDGKEKPKPVALAVPGATVVAFAALSWSVFRSHNRAFGFLMFVSVCLYAAVLVMFSRGAVVQRILGDAPKLAFWVGVFVLFGIHSYFGQVLYEYAMALREKDGRPTQGHKEDMSVLV